MRNAYPPPAHNYVNEQPSGTDGWLRVPVGEGSDRWVTLVPQRKVLFVVRTATTLVRLLDLGRTVLSDARVQIVFTIADGRSAFATALEERIRAAGGVYVPWSQACAIEFDLAVSLSSNGPLHLIQAPLLLMSHGPGRTKTLGQQAGAGSCWQELLRHREHPLVIGLTSADEEKVFSKEACAAAHDGTSNVRFEVIGDIMLDELRDAMLVREHLRQAMDIGGRKLAVLSSSWGDVGAFPANPHLASQLLASLPADEYAVATILHPNTWVGHGEWQVRTWLADAVDAGLILVPFESGWQATVAMADRLLGDHGSVTLYAQLLGIPTARLSNPKEQMRGQLPLVREMSKAPLLASPRDACEFCTGNHACPSADDATALQRQFVANVGSAREALRDLVYTIIELDPPESNPPHLIPPLPPRGKRVSTWRVTLIRSNGSYEVVRHPGSADGYAPRDGWRGDRRPAFSALASSLDEGDYRMLQACDIALVDMACLTSGRWRGVCPNARLAAAAANSHEFAVRDRGESSWTARLIDGPGDPYAVMAAVAYAIMGRSSAAEFSLAGRPARVELHKG